MNEKRKFAQHILPGSYHTRKKESKLLEGEDDVPDFGWGSCIPEPVDYERYLAEHKGSIVGDPHRELLLFPSEDLKLIRLAHTHRVANAGVPEDALKSNIFSSNPLGRHAVGFFANKEWPYIHQSSVIYRGHFCKLPRTTVTDNLVDALTDYWFSTDHLDAVDPAFTTSSKHSPSHTSVQSTTAPAGSRSWTAAVLSNRSRSFIADVSQSGEPLRSTDGHPPTTDLPPSKRAIRTKSKQASTGKSENAAVDNTASKPSSADSNYMECSLAVGSRDMYQTFLRIRESHLASGDQPSNTKPDGILFQAYCLRQLQADELSGRLHPVDRPRNSVGNVASGIRNSTTRSRLREGQYVIAPVGWRAFDDDRHNGSKEEIVIFLDSVTEIHAIGDNWLKLDHTSSSSSSTEWFAYFDDSAGGFDRRQTWLQSIENILRAQRSQQRLGYQRSFEYVRPLWRAQTRSDSTDGPSTDSELHHSDISVGVLSARGALQRYTQETEFLINHQRQKGRLKLITVYPEVRLAYDQSASTAEGRSHVKSSSSPQRSNSVSVVRDTRTPRLNGSASKKKVETARVSPPPTGPIQRPFPDRTAQVCGRRFLATCLTLKSCLQTVIEIPDAVMPSCHLDNPEPYFVTLFLVNTLDGQRVSDDFHWNPNSKFVDSMVARELFRQLVWNVPATNAQHEVSHPVPVSKPARPHRGQAPPPPPVQSVTTPLGIRTSVQSEDLCACRSALFSVPTNFPSVGHIYLVVRVDKVLNGAVNAAADKYVKAANLTDEKIASTGSTTDNKLMGAIHRSMLTYCRHLGRYRMPFAWGARSLSSRFRHVPLFKLDPAKLSESAFTQMIQSFARLAESSVPGVNGTSAGTMSVAEKRATLTSGASMVMWDYTGREDPAVELIERNLKTQSLPLRLEIVVSELGDQADEGINAGDLSFVTADLLSIPSNDINQSVPSTHPPLRQHELIREVEHMWDSRTCLTAVTSAETGSGVAVDSDSSMPFNQSSSSLHRGSHAMPSNLLVASPGRNNRDSILSNSSGSGSIHIDPTWPASSSVIHSRTNSLDRPVTRSANDPSGRAAASFFPELVPFTTFLNALYVSPKSLNLAVKHGFSRARNLSCFIELRSADDLQTNSALNVFHTRPSVRQDPFDSWFNTAVTYHESSPNFNDTAKLCVPLRLTGQYHLLFRFYHVSVDAAGSLSVRDRPSSKKLLESSTGYAWLPILGADGK